MFCRSNNGNGGIIHESLAMIQTRMWVQVIKNVSHCGSKEKKNTFFCKIALTINGSLEAYGYKFLIVNRDLCIKTLLFIRILHGNCKLHLGYWI